MKEFEQRTATINGKSYTSQKHLPSIKVGEHIITQTLWKLSPPIVPVTQFTKGSQWWHTGHIAGVEDYIGMVTVMTEPNERQEDVLVEFPMEIQGSSKWWVHQSQLSPVPERFSIGSKWFYDATIPAHGEPYKGWVTIHGTPGNMSNGAEWIICDLSTTTSKGEERLYLLTDHLQKVAPPVTIEDCVVGSRFYHSGNILGLSTEYDGMVTIDSVYCNRVAHIIIDTPPQNMASEWYVHISQLEWPHA